MLSRRVSGRLWPRGFRRRRRLYRPRCAAGRTMGCLPRCDGGADGWYGEYTSSDVVTISARDARLPLVAARRSAPLPRIAYDGPRGARAAQAERAGSPQVTSSGGISRKTSRGDALPLSPADLTSSCAFAPRAEPGTRSSPCLGMGEWEPDARRRTARACLFLVVPAGLRPLVGARRGDSSGNLGLPSDSSASAGPHVRGKAHLLGAYVDGETGLHVVRSRRRRRSVRARIDGARSRDRGVRRNVTPVPANESMIATRYDRRARP